MDINTLESLATGDRDALRQCLLLVTQWAVSKGIPREDANDIAAETAGRAADNAASYRSEAKVDSWIIGIADKVCKEDFRHRSRKAPWAESLEDLPVEIEDEIDVENMALMRLVADAAMDGLTEAEKQAFLLCARDSLSSEEAGKAMGKSGNAVRCLKFRAAKKIGKYHRDFLQGRGCIP